VCLPFLVGSLFPVLRGSFCEYYYYETATGSDTYILFLDWLEVGWCVGWVNTYGFVRFGDRAQIGITRAPYLTRTNFSRRQLCHAGSRPAQSAPQTERMHVMGRTKPLPLKKKT
jgi:hypothetical protein